jgi:TfoX/Sxy family transcriptional regulator of competence genes
MSSNQSTVDFILEQAAAAGSVSARRMFGEYGLYCDGKFIGAVCDDRLYLKPTAAGRAFIEESGEVEEAPPYPGAKDYFHIDGGRWDDAEWLAEVVRITTRDLPVKKK